MTKKKTKGKQNDYIQHRVGVFATESDLKNSDVAFLAVQCGLIKPENYMIVDKEVGEGDDKKTVKEIVVTNYTEESIQAILKNLFGFRDGWYEVEVVEKQKTLLTGQIVLNEKRYTGLEREDKAWVSSRMCSDQMKTAVLFGSHGEI